MASVIEAAGSECTDYSVGSPNPFSSLKLSWEHESESGIFFFDEIEVVTSSAIG